jgi:hypothetical protein
MRRCIILGIKKLIANMLSFKAAYVVDNKTRCVGIWVWVVDKAVHGQNTWKFSIRQKQPTKEASKRTLV